MVKSKHNFELEKKNRMIDGHDVAPCCTNSYV